MSARLLPVVVAFTCLGIGCDDPEVQSKVSNIMEHGIVDAYLECTQMTWNVCTYTSIDHLEINKFIDGSSYFEIVGDGSNWTPTFHGFKHRGKNFLEFSHVLPNTGTWTAEIVDGDIEISAECMSTPPVEYASVPLETYCSGFNLEAFGIDP